MIEESNYGDAYSLDIEASKAAVEKYGEFIDEYEKITLDNFAWRNPVKD